MNDVDVSKKMQAPAKGVPIAKCKTIWAAERIMAVMDHSTKNPWLHSDTQNKKKNKNLWVLGREGEGKDFLYQNILTNKCKGNDGDSIYCLSAIILIPLITKVIIYIF